MNQMAANAGFLSSLPPRDDDDELSVGSSPSHATTSTTSTSTSTTTGSDGYYPCSLQSSRMPDARGILISSQIPLSCGGGERGFSIPPASPRRRRRALPRPFSWLRCRLHLPHHPHHEHRHQHQQRKEQEHERFLAFAAIAAIARSATNFESLADPTVLRGRRTGVLHPPAAPRRQRRSPHRLFPWPHYHHHLHYLHHRHHRKRRVSSAFAAIAANARFARNFEFLAYPAFL